MKNPPDFADFENVEVLSDVAGQSRLIQRRLEIIGAAAPVRGKPVTG